MIVQRGKDHHNRTQTRPFVSLPERLPRSGERGGNYLPPYVYLDVLRSRLAELYASVRETNRRPFRALCGDDPL
ncbi:hypothetical protein P4S95_23675 [Aneurinibacillus aneurinilyticus]|uniref:hypothetical protein n=1 Tax=Aneurinibacillus aneurinilyticus TaxID=1391 RepID=UPI002E251D65|nr:hypothetical protein [Aneurinibacillus aneurinilyticus]